jgi:hypothetical protein
MQRSVLCTLSLRGHFLLGLWGGLIFLLSTSRINDLVQWHVPDTQEPRNSPELRI